MSKNKVETSRNKGFNSFIESAFVVIIGQNALLLSRPILALFESQISVFDFIVICIIGIINTINIIFIWVSNKENAHNYSSKYMIWDIVTLVCFFTLTQVCIDSFVNNTLVMNINHIILVFVSIYFLIYSGYFFWNLENVKLNNAQGVLKQRLNQLNTVIVIYLLNLLAIGIFTIAELPILMNISAILSLIIVGIIFAYFVKVSRVASLEEETNDYSIQEEQE